MGASVYVLSNYLCRTCDTPWMLEQRWPLNAPKGYLDVICRACKTVYRIKVAIQDAEILGTEEAGTNAPV